MMTARIRSLTTRRSRDERGSISVWFATAALAMIILVGMAVGVAFKGAGELRAEFLRAAD